MYEVWVFSLHVSKCIVCVPGAWESWKSTSDPLKLESQKVVSYRVSTESQGSYQLSASPGQIHSFLRFFNNYQLSVNTGFLDSYLYNKETIEIQKLLLRQRRTVLLERWRWKAPSCSLPALLGFSIKVKASSYSDEIEKLQRTIQHVPDEVWWMNEQRNEKRISRKCDPCPRRRVQREFGDRKQTSEGCFLALNWKDAVTTDIGVCVFWKK